MSRKSRSLSNITFPFRLFRYSRPCSQAYLTVSSPEEVLLFGQKIYTLLSWAAIFSLYRKINFFFLFSLVCLSRISLPLQTPPCTQPLFLSEFPTFLISHLLLYNLGCPSFPFPWFPFSPPLSRSNCTSWPAKSPETRYDQDPLIFGMS